MALVPNNGTIISDRGYDSKSLREQTRVRKNVSPVIPHKRNSQKGNDGIDWYLYRYRHLVENAFAHLKQYRAIATRYAKLARNYAASLVFTCCIH